RLDLCDSHSVDGAAGRTTSRSLLTFAIIIATVLATLATFATGSAASALQEPVTLEPGKQIERDLAASEKHTYQLALREAEYAKVIVEQRGIDVVVRSLAASGEVIAESDQESTLNGEEKAELVAADEGLYKIEVESKYKTFPAG